MSLHTEETPMAAAPAAGRREKFCPGCPGMRPIGEFDRNRARPDGLQSQCRACREAYVAGHRAAVRARGRAYSGRDREAERARSRAYYARMDDAGRARLRARKLRQRYGLTVGMREKLLAAQGGVCAICKRRPDEIRGGRLCVDHDHGKGNGIASVRGLVCAADNIFLAWLDDEERRRAAEAYRARPPAMDMDLVGWAADEASNVGRGQAAAQSMSGPVSSVATG